MTQRHALDGLRDALFRLKTADKYPGAYNENQGNGDFFRGIQDCIESLVTEVEVLNTLVEEDDPDKVNEKRLQHTLKSLSRALEHGKLYDANKAVELAKIQLAQIDDTKGQYTKELEALSRNTLQLSVTTSVTSALTKKYHQHLKEESMSTIQSTIMAALEAHTEVVTPNIQQTLLNKIIDAAEKNIKTDRFPALYHGEAKLKTNNTLQADIEEAIFSCYESVPTP